MMTTPTRSCTPTSASPTSTSPGHDVNMVFLQSGTPGDWALGTFLGPVASETRAWLDHLATGQPCHLATPTEARQNLEVTLAIEEAARSRETIRLPASGGGNP